MDDGVIVTSRSGMTQADSLYLATSRTLEQYNFVLQVGETHLLSWCTDIGRTEEGLETPISHWHHCDSEDWTPFIL